MRVHPSGEQPTATAAMYNHDCMVCALEADAPSSYIVSDHIARLRVSVCGTDGSSLGGGRENIPVSQ